jgi:hypothetical protein
MAPSSRGGSQQAHLRLGGSSSGIEQVGLDAKQGTPGIQDFRQTGTAAAEGYDA